MGDIKSYLRLSSISKLKSSVSFLLAILLVIYLICLAKLLGSADFLINLNELNIT